VRKLRKRKGPASNARTQKKDRKGGKKEKKQEGGGGGATTVKNSWELTRARKKKNGKTKKD